ncbi:hypothetical protein Y032_0677g1437 [Ancylostoma ceylanicum]|uniref:Thioredoxin domain-containing protein 17 n=1 Tax=Ancylostoma ceylanicum TaxID=53326 RepID=A0A016WIK4_9BILA|nr:hypothetical protein Y032_0677g1437 [Ancylostoma ceylanicum]
MREVIVEGYDAIRKELTSLSGQVFVLFTGSKVDGKSWCPDCVAAEPVIDSILHGNEGKSLDATFVTCYVGAREYWKDPACPFRTDKDFKLTCVPTLIEVGKKDDRGETAGSLARKENVHSWNGDQQCRKFRASSTLNWSQAPRHLLRLPSTKRLIPPL